MGWIAMRKVATPRYDEREPEHFELEPVAHFQKRPEAAAFALEHGLTLVSDKHERSDSADE